MATAAVQGSASVDHDRLKAEPHRLIELTITEKFSFDRDELEAIQLAGLKKRFNDLLPHVQVLQRFAEEQGLSEITSLEDGALLLFPHTMYKSYPASAIEKNRYDQMTRWVGTLTAIDLDHVDSSACRSIDDWIDLLDAQTDIRMRHSSGTTGKLSFVPMATVETRSSVIGIRRSFEGFGDEPDAGVEGLGTLPLIAFGYRHGSQSFPRSVDAIIEHFYGGDASRVLCLNPGRISADVASLAGRLEGARAKGTLGQKQLAPGLIDRREQFLREQAEAPRHLDRFFERCADEFRGQRVVLNGVLPPVVDTAVKGLERKLEGLFARDSLFFIAGGTKGQSLPADYREQVTRFTGVPFPRPGYGMTEGVSAITRMCPAGHYHIVPNLIPYLLDPDSGQPLPRAGTHTGRLGIIDLGTQTRWGGFLTGDEVTLNHGGLSPCDCGRKGAFIQGEIRRYSELRGGDDKITCAGAPGIADKALDFMATIAG
ncbi:hypothetical protein [Sphingobium sp. EM0848]|uniref:hypothetical protein n=1 Tax=Sphingobium sp. EM0848 TaxID=2743473 RepID=UPI00159C3363|nr:hypothetical protein [Sphingobium sp. EM0848]